MEEKCKISERIKILRQALNSDKSKVAFLLGAGCPQSIKINNKPLIPGIAELTKIIINKLETIQIEKLVQGIDLPVGKQVTIEDILSRVRLLIDAIGKSTFEELDKDKLIKIEASICERITGVVERKLPDEKTPYHHLAAWITGMQRGHPVEIFTLNYDLLMESALESYSIPYFDGFIGVQKAFFDLHSMEYDEIPSRWARLWKLHGSVNWWIDPARKIFRGVTNDKKSYEQMIYPSHLKYSQSRKMPYLAMQDRLSNFLSNGQSILITNGYSFSDQHLNEIIMQKLSVNKKSLCFGLLYENMINYPEAKECASNRPNLHLLAKDAAYYKGGEKIWDEVDGDLHSFLYKKDENITMCDIGNFKSFGKFLIAQASDSEIEKSNE